MSTQKFHYEKKRIRIAAIYFTDYCTAQGYSEKIVPSVAEELKEVLTPLQIKTLVAELSKNDNQVNKV